MKHLKTFTALLIGLLCSLSPMAYGHSGGVDAAGCHNDHSSGGYHCHNDSDDDVTWGRLFLWTGGIIAVAFIATKLMEDSEEEQEEHNVNSIKPEFQLTNRDAMGGLSWSHGALSANGLTDGEKLEGTLQLEFPISR